MSASPPPLQLHIQRGDTRYGPYPLDQVQSLLAEKRLQPGDLAWCTGETSRQPLHALLRQLGLTPAAPSADESLKWVLPVGRSPLAIAAGYAGLFSVLAFPGPIALALGLFALRDFRKHPERLGRGRAWFGIVMGSLGTIFVLFLLAAIVTR